MAATAITSIIAQVRDFLVEVTPKYWSDSELTSLFNLGAFDLWGSILDEHAEHFFTVDSTNVSLAANTNQLTGVPADCFRVLQIEPRDISSSGPGNGVIFTPGKYKDPDFVAARTMDAADISEGVQIMYQVSGVGTPISAPVIYTAPQLTSSLNLSLVYCPSLTIGSNNPIPGESDNALKAWILAYALAKEAGAGARIPDAGWLSIYATEKQHIITRITPRQEQDPDVVEDFYKGVGHV